MSMRVWRERCEVWREDRNDERRVVYSGACALERGRSEGGDVKGYADRVYVEGVTEIEENDGVDVETATGRRFSGIVSKVTELYVGLRGGGYVTELELRFDRGGLDDGRG